MRAIFSIFTVLTRTTYIPTAEYLSAWQVLGNLEIAEVLRDYVASSPQREQICLFLSSWLGISK